MIDTLIRMQPVIAETTLAFTPPERFCIATLHRPSNVDSAETLRQILGFLAVINDRCPVIFPLHLRTQKAIERFGFEPLLRKIRVVEPLGYLEFLSLLFKAAFVLTDSGGIQEEATFLQKRCFTLRRNTERPSTVKSGSNVLMDPLKEADQHAVLAYASSSKAPDVTIPEKWDGKAGERILNILSSLF
jgi:UDP-N-acetylglucosamine 2-epimerase (non-hydrolysing)